MGLLFKLNMKEEFCPDYDDLNECNPDEDGSKRWQDNCVKLLNALLQPTQYREDVVALIGRENLQEFDQIMASEGLIDLDFDLSKSSNFSKNFVEIYLAKSPVFNETFTKVANLVSKVIARVGPLLEKEFKSYGNNVFTPSRSAGAYVPVRHRSPEKFFDTLIVSKMKALLHFSEDFLKKMEGIDSYMMKFVNLFFRNLEEELFILFLSSMENCINDHQTKVNLVKKISNHTGFNGKKFNQFAAIELLRLSSLRTSVDGFFSKYSESNLKNMEVATKRNFDELVDLTLEKVFVATSAGDGRWLDLEIVDFDGATSDLSKSTNVNAFLVVRVRIRYQGKIVMNLDLCRVSRKLYISGSNLEWSRYLSRDAKVQMESFISSTLLTLLRKNSGLVKIDNLATTPKYCSESEGFSFGSVDDLSDEAFDIDFVSRGIRDYLDSVGFESGDFENNEEISSEGEKGGEVDSGEIFLSNDEFVYDQEGFEGIFPGEVVSHSDEDNLALRSFRDKFRAHVQSSSGAVNILEAVRKIGEGDLSLLDLRKLKMAEGIWACRVGKYRIIFKEDSDGKYKILNFGSRGQAYQRRGMY